MQRVRGRKWSLQPAIYGVNAVGGGGGGSPTIFLTASLAADNAFAGPTFPTATLAVGSYNPTTDDLFVFVGSQGPAFTGVTVQPAGASAVSALEVNADSQTGIWVIPRGSGVTATSGKVALAFSVSGFTVSGYGIVIGYVHGAASGTPTSHQTNAFTFFADPLQLASSAVVPTNGVGAAFWYNENNTDNPITTWFGATKVAAAESTNATGNTFEVSGATQSTAGTYTIGVRQTGGPGPTSGSMAFVAFA
jgi:hypothetical protein